MASALEAHAFTSACAPARAPNSMLTHPAAPLGISIGTVTAALTREWDQLKASIKPGHAAVLSGATGAEPATAEERAFLEAHGDLPVRATGSYIGHGLEPQFVMNIALAALALDHASLFPPCDSSGLERPMSGDLQQILVTSVGHWRGEGLALVERAD